MVYFSGGTNGRSSRPRPMCVSVLASLCVCLSDCMGVCVYSYICVCCWYVVV